jgi:hypothetical protein
MEEFEEFNEEYFRDLETPMHFIEDGLFLGSIDAARDRSLLNQNNITRVVSLLDMFDEDDPSGFFESRNSFRYLEPFDSSIDHLKLKLSDFYTSNILKYVPEAIKFISESQKIHRNVLVHCAAGISRSSSIVIAFLMIKYSLNFDEAKKIVKTKRRCICPNQGFESQLTMINIDEYKQY